MSNKYWKYVLIFKKNNYKTSNTKKDNKINIKKKEIVKKCQESLLFNAPPPLLKALII
jgi:hypothetical protein